MKQKFMEKDIEKFVTTRQNQLEYKRFQDAFLIDIIWYSAYEDVRWSLFSGVAVYKLPVSQIIGGLLLCMPFFQSWLPLNMLFILGVLFFAWAWLIFAGFKSFGRIAVYKKTLRYLESKDSIVALRDKLELNIQDDMQNNWIDIAILGDIKKCIVSILEWYRIISASHNYILNHRWYFGKISRECQEIVNTEFQWIINYSQDFTHLIQSWMSHHANELAKLEKQIESQELATENSGWKAALGLQRLSLQEHLKELEKVKV